jgi:transcriptional regulator with XRE-family HTH domain
MINRILLVLKTQNLTSSQFADEIGVQRSSISHILSGRNNPSLEFVTKILKRFPDINSEWILFGKGSMYRESESSLKNKLDKKPIVQADLFSYEESEQVEMPAINQAILNDDEFYENHIDKNTPINPVHISENVLFNQNILQEKTDEKNKKTERNESIESEIKKCETEEPEIKKKKKEIEKIVIFYSDKTFKEYFPE